MTKVSLEKDTIGLIVRGKKDDSHSPGVMEQHADCILSNGEPVGFFGGAGDGSSNSGSSGSSGSSSDSSVFGPSGFWNKTGMNMVGRVDYYQDFIDNQRPYYVMLDLATRVKLYSTVLLIKVTPTQAQLFDTFWSNLKLNPGAFNLLGNNCSTHASDAFIAAKIVAKGIPGLDTPNNLYKQLKAKTKGNYSIHSGYIGFDKVPSQRRNAFYVNPLK